MSYSVSQLAKYLDVSTGTIRNWGSEFAEHLSEGANPISGVPREYTDGDAAILETVAVLRDQYVSYEEIEERLAGGERLAFQDRPDGAQKELKEGLSGAKGETALVTESFSQALQMYGDQVERLQNRIDTLTDRVLEAEKRATAAETELRVLKDQAEQKRAVGAENQGIAGGVTEVEQGRETRRPWWRFWRD